MSLYISILAVIISFFALVFNWYVHKDNIKYLDSKYKNKLIFKDDELMILWDSYFKIKISEKKSFFKVASQLEMKLEREQIIYKKNNDMKIDELKELISNLEDNNKVIILESDSKKYKDILLENLRYFSKEYR
jgi:hypothetical protein